MSVNKAIILGRLGQNPELKYTPSGNAVCSFSVATSDAWKDKSGQKQEKTEWHRIQVWGKLAEICNQYLKKGSEVYLEGKIQTSSWEKDGIKQYMTQINASVVNFVGSGNREISSKEEPRQLVTTTEEAMKIAEAVFVADEIPF